MLHACAADTSTFWEARLASHVTTPAKHGDEPDRRDFLVIAGNMFAAVGGAAALWPFVDQMNPDAGAQALASTEFDMAPVKEGQAVTIMWRGKPVFVRHRTKEEIEKAGKVDLKTLPDNHARNDLLPEVTDGADANRVKKGKEQWLVMVGICTHLGCIPKGQSMGDERGEFGGWYFDFDLFAGFAGRIKLWAFISKDPESCLARIVVAFHANSQRFIGGGKIAMRRREIPVVLNFARLWASAQVRQ